MTPTRILAGPLLLAVLALTAARSPGAASPEPADAPREDAAPPPVDEAVRVARRTLRELDRFLDHHPLLETDLRLDGRRAGDAVFVGHNPEFRDFLVGHPGVLPALAAEPRHLLHRALIREAETPLRFAEIAQLDPFLAAHADIELALTKNPGAIHDRRFLDTHAALRDFIATHPVFETAFPPAGAKP